MSGEIINTLLLGCMFLCLFTIAELLYYQLKIKADVTRKIVHIGTGLLSMLFPVMLGNHWLVLLLCASFGLCLFISLRFHLLRSINAIDRVSYGSLLYPLAVYISFLTYLHFQNSVLFFYLPVLTMAICDPVAAIFGKRWAYGKFYIYHDVKTATGCLAFFVSSVILTLILLTLIPHDIFNANKALVTALLVAATTTITEAISTKGFDNITIPLCVILVLTLVHA